MVALLSRARVGIVSFAVIHLHERTCTAISFLNCWIQGSDEDVAGQVDLYQAERHRNAIEAAAEIAEAEDVFEHES